MMAFKLLYLPGDGIGPEVTAQVALIAQYLTDKGILAFETDSALIGGAAYDATGNPLPPETLTKAKAADAILLGAVGGPKWEPLAYAVRPERGLLGIRKELGLFANLRPAICFAPLVDASSLKPEIVAGLDIMIVRELTGDIYFGEPRGVETLADGSRRGVNTMVYTTEEIRRIGRVAFDLAAKRNGKVCSVDKANVLETTELWREEMEWVKANEFPSLQLSHMYVDNAAMQLVRTPKQFDVMVTGNIFGDILSDAAAMLTGSLGMLPSASLGAADSSGKRPALYEPVHGSAPDIAGQGKANPLATILSFAMLLRYSADRGDLADSLEQAVNQTLEAGIRTGDIAKPGDKVVGTAEMGKAVLERFAAQVQHAQTKRGAA
jgi:3-isopropylmalate dehydrogenase